MLPVPVFGSAGDCCRAKQLFLSEVPAGAAGICGFAAAQEKTKERLNAETQSSRRNRSEEIANQGAGLELGGEK